MKTEGGQQTTRPQGKKSSTSGIAVAVVLGEPAGGSVDHDKLRAIEPLAAHDGSHQFQLKADIAVAEARIACRVAEAAGIQADGAVDGQARGLEVKEQGAARGVLSIYRAVIAGSVQGHVPLLKEGSCGLITDDVGSLGFVAPVTRLV